MLSQCEFETIDLLIINQFAEKYESGDVRDIQSLQDTITGGLITIMMG